MDSSETTTKSKRLCACNYFANAVYRLRDTSFTEKIPCLCLKTFLYKLALKIVKTNFIRTIILPHRNRQWPYLTLDTAELGRISNDNCLQTNLCTFEYKHQLNWCILLFTNLSRNYTFSRKKVNLMRFSVCIEACCIGSVKKKNWVQTSSDLPKDAATVHTDEVVTDNTSTLRITQGMAVESVNFFEKHIC